MKPIGFHISNFWRFLYKQGVSEERSLQNLTIINLNQAAAITALGALASGCVMLFFKEQYPIHPYFMFGLFFVYSLIIVLHKLKKHQYVKHYISFIVPLWIYAAILLTGSFFSQSIATVATLVLVVFFYPKNTWFKWSAAIYNFLLYILATSYVALFAPIMQIPDMPVDETLVFVTALVWIKIVFTVHEFEREEFIKSLLEKNNELQQTTEELERFTHIASHDLKSPLRTIISFLDLMQRDINRERYQNLDENLAFAKSGAKQLNYLIKDVLEISRINTRGEKEREVVNLSQTLNKVLFNVESELKEKHAQINASPLPHFECNEVEFILLFQNLIQNGIKYNESKPPVLDIWAAKEEGSLKIYFKDNGIGIEAKYKDYIFEHFKRLHTSSEYSGTGLGLSLCKKIIKSYNGAIHLESEPGRGSTFIVELPVAANGKMPRTENRTVGQLV